MNEPPTKISQGQRATGGLSAPFVRVFSLSTGEPLAGELGAHEMVHGTSPAQELLQAAVKLLVPSHWQSSITRVVSSFAGLTWYTQRQAGCEVTLLIIGQVREIQACARSLLASDPSTAPLALEVITQLRRISPRAYHTLACGARRLDFAVKTGIMGILNVTPDSFYDGGRYIDLQLAVERARQMVAEGADMIDIGGQSSRPGALPISESEEEDRVLPVVEAVAKSVSTIISVDTYRAGIARAALDAGAHMINDISALRFDPALLEVVAERRVPLIVMHMRGTPRDMQLNPSYDALIDEVFAFLQERLTAAQTGGIPAEHLLIDPGIGFGKATQHNLELLRKLHHFHALGRPLVIGTSRKSFIGKILGTGVDERLEGTAGTVAAAIVQGADIIRVHDVQAMVRVARILDALVRPHFLAEASAHKSVEPGKCAAKPTETHEPNAW